MHTSSRHDIPYSYITQYIEKQSVSLSLVHTHSHTDTHPSSWHLQAVR